MGTKPEVFIIESLTLKDEAGQRFEGEIIKRILAMSDKQCEYYYIRTERELKRILQLFSKSRYRYLHLSCHGNRSGLATTLDSLSLASVAELLNPHIKNRRVFISACSLANESLARLILPHSGCYSILGPAKDVTFSDAVMVWSSLYHTMFAADAKVMKKRELAFKAREIATMYDVPLNLYTRSSSSRAFDSTNIKPDRRAK